MSNIDKRQFIIASEKVERENFCYRCLDNELILSYEKSLKIVEICDGILIGLAFTIDNGCPVDKNNQQPLEERLRKWAGRYIVYSKGKIYTDVGNALGIFYMEKDNKCIASSSVHLLSQEYGIERNSCQLLYGKGKGEERGGFLTDFFPGPYTPYEGIKRLMTYETLDFNSEPHVIKNKQAWNQEYVGMDSKELTAKLLEYTDCIFKNIAQEYDSIYVPLTAGKDSRCVAAMAKHANVKIRSFTEQRDFRTHKINVLKSEKKIAEDVARVLDIPWIFSKRKKWDQSKYNEILTHSGKMIRNASLYTYAYGQYPQPKEEEKMILIHGSVWEIALEFYVKRLGVLSKETGVETIKKRCTFTSKSRVHEESLNVWGQEQEKYGISTLSLTEHLYHEQRMGAWLSDLNQALDIVDFDRVTLINNYEILSILMAYPKEIRTKALHQIEIAEACCPQLSDIPINKKSKPEKIYSDVVFFKDRCVAKIKKNIHK